MAKKKDTTVVQKSAEELKALVNELRETLQKLRMDHAKGQVKKTSDFTNTRKQIARALTALREKEEKK